jgi:hypothetical protein
MLRRYGRETRYANFECVGHCHELCMVREVGLEEVLGLGNAADVWVRGVWRMRDFSLPGRPGKPGQRNQQLDVWGRRRSNGRQGCVDVGVGGRCRRGPQAVRGCRVGRHFSADRYAVERPRDACAAFRWARVSGKQGHRRVRISDLAATRRTREKTVRNPQPAALRRRDWAKLSRESWHNVIERHHKQSRDS